MVLLNTAERSSWAGAGQDFDTNFTSFSLIRTATPPHEHIDTLPNGRLAASDLHFQIWKEGEGTEQVGRSGQVVVAEQVLDVIKCLGGRLPGAGGGRGLCGM